jgi:hypothetical protein
VSYNIPKVSVIFRSNRNSFCTINDASSANSQDDVGLFIFTQLNAFMDRGETRIRLDAAEFGNFSINGFLLGQNTVINTIPLNTPSPVNQQNPFAVF